MLTYDESAGPQSGHRHLDVQEGEIERPGYTSGRHARISAEGEGRQEYDRSFADRPLEELDHDSTDRRPQCDVPNAGVTTHRGQRHGKPDAWSTISPINSLGPRRPAEWMIETI